MSPTFTEGGGHSHLPIGSTDSMRSRTFLENAIPWRPIVKKYRSLKEAPAAGAAAAVGAMDAAPPGTQLINPLDNRAAAAAGDEEKEKMD